MTDDIPSQITLYPPSIDVETSQWGLLAPMLWHAGLIWRDYEQVVLVCDRIETRIWCTFTDRHAFDSWRVHDLLKKSCPEILASKIDVVEVMTPFSRHESRCDCDQSSSLILTSHGFGNCKSVLTCCDCLGYYPNYRSLDLLDDIYPQLQSWAMIAGHVYDIWMATADFKDWALNQLKSPESQLNTTGRELANQIHDRIEKPMWYLQFIPSDIRTTNCPSCGVECESPQWSRNRYICAGCRLVF